MVMITAAAGDMFGARRGTPLDDRPKEITDINFATGIFQYGSGFRHERDMECPAY